MCNKEHIFLLWIPVTSTPKLPICHCSQSVNIFLWTKKGKEGAKKNSFIVPRFCEEECLQTQQARVWRGNKNDIQK